MKNSHSPDTIPIKCEIPPELQAMMKDFVIITNHFISYGIHAKIGYEKHYYPLAITDISGKQKLIPMNRELRDAPLNKEWFDKNYREKNNEKYHSHYRHSAAAFASQMIKSWRTNGGDITATPHLRNPIARLDSFLFTIKRNKNNLHIRIAIAPRNYVTIEAIVNHKHWNEWSLNRSGELVIVPSGLRLCFTDDIDVPKAKESVAYDFNFDRVIMARSDGEIKEVDLKDVIEIQKNHKRKRESVQKTMRHNLQKAQRLLQKNSGREHNRVNDLLHKMIHGKNNEILSFVQDRHLGIEDLHNTTKDILKDDHGREFNAKMSNWIHGTFEQIITHHHIDSSLYYTRGTSRYCPFCNSTLTHPIWKQSVCPIHGLFDRDFLEAVSGLVRTNTKHKKGQTWALVNTVFPESIEAKLLHNSLLSNSSMMIRGLSPEMESVHPECAIFYPEVQSDIDNSNIVMHENRSDVDIQKNIGFDLNQVESGNDAKSNIDTFVYKR